MAAASRGTLTCRERQHGEQDAVLAPKATRPPNFAVMQKAEAKRDFEPAMQQTLATI